MSVEIERRRVLLAARPTETVELRTLFLDAALQPWEAVEADTFERARFLLQHHACDILLVDESLYHQTGPAGLTWLARQREAPTLFLGGLEPDVLALAYEQGVSLCLPRRLAMDNPSVLAAALKRTAHIADLERCEQRSKEGWQKCRRHVDRLVNLLWRTAPMDPGHQWLTHRHMLQRLQEEVSRCGRHGSVFTVALGEVVPPPGEHSEDETNTWHEWMTDTLAHAKRRCDLGGHYGLQGFMLVMVQTPKPGGVACCRRLQQVLRDANQASKGPYGPIRACFGLSTFTAETATPQGLLSQAEKHLEAARAGMGEGVVASE